MAWDATIGGQTFNQDNVNGTAFANEATGFPAIVKAVALLGDSLKGVMTTSTTAMTPGTGTKSFTLAAALSLDAGALVQIRSVSDSTHYMVGPITSLSGTALDVNVTFANGGSSISDWAVGAHALFTPFDANGDFRVPNGSISALGADPNFGAGGNRAMMDIAAGVARIGAIAGGGSGVQTQLMVAGSQMITSDSNSNHKSIHGGNRFYSGNIAYQYDSGTVSSGTVSVSWTSTDYQKITMGGNFSIDVLAPDTGFWSVKTLLLKNDATGGRVPTFKRAGTTTQIKWITPEPTWASLAANVAIRVLAQYDQDSGWLYLQADVDVQS